MNVGWKHCDAPLKHLAYLRILDCANATLSSTTVLLAAIHSSLYLVLCLFHFTLYILDGFIRLPEVRTQIFAVGEYIVSLNELSQYLFRDISTHRSQSHPISPREKEG